MSEHYILDAEHNAKPAELMEWARWFETDNKRVAKDELSENVIVSTVFLGIDHQFGEGPPLLFETMVFQDGDDALQWRYSTWGEAERGHARAVELVREYQGINRSLADLYSEDRPEPSEPSK